MYGQEVWTDSGLISMDNAYGWIVDKSLQVESLTGATPTWTDNRKSLATRQRASQDSMDVERQ